jgi:hypothetical protein
MAKQNNQDRIRNEARETAVVVEDALRSISSKIGDIFEEALNAGEGVSQRFTRDVQSGLNSLAKVSNEIASANLKAEKGLLKQRDVTKQIQERQSKIAALKVQIEIAERRGLSNVNELKKQLQKVEGFNEEITNELQKQANFSNNINKSIGLTGAALSGAAKLTSKIGLSGLDHVFEDARDAAVEKAKSLGVSDTKALGLVGKFKVMVTSVKSVGKGLISAFKDPVVLGGLLVKAFKSLLALGGKIAGQSADLGAAFLGAGRDSDRIASNLRDMAAGDVFLSIEESMKAFTAMNNAAGTFTEFSKEQVKNFKQISHDLGLGEEATQGLFQVSTMFGQGMRDTTDQVGAVVQGLNLSTNSSINLTDVMKEVANSSASVRFNLENNPKALANAAFNAKRLGMSLDDIKSASESTLDFESSIAKEMQAELLLGKELNLEQYRQAALTGDTETATKEMNRLISENKDEIKGNVIAQQAFADSLGISVDQLLKSIQTQELQDKLAAKGITDRVKAQEALNYLKSKGLSDDEALLKLSKDNLDSTIKNKEAQEASTRTLNEAKEIFQASLAPLAKNLAESLAKFVKSDAFKSLADTIKKIASFIGGLSGTQLGVGLAGALGAVFLAQKAIPQLVTLSGKGLGSMFGKKGPKAGKAASKLSPKQIAAGFGGKAAKDALLKEGGEVAAKSVGKSAAKGASKAGTKAGLKGLGKIGGKTLLKRVPVLGSLVGVGFAIDRAIKGDGVGALMELGSAGLGLVDLVAPGVGTALSLAADAGIAARDIKRAGTITPTATASDFIVKDGKMTKFRKDDVVVGGTNLGGGSTEVISLLERLVSAVENGGTVTLDGQKVGQAMVLGSYQLQ